MTAARNTPPSAKDADPLTLGLRLQDEAMRLLFSEIRALQAMLPAGGAPLPDEAETEAGFDNMPV